MYHIPVPGARLWWPRGYGDPNLYAVTVQLRQHQSILAEVTETMGIRRVKIDRTDKAGLAWKPMPAGNGAVRIDKLIDPESHF